MHRESVAMLHYLHRCCSIQAASWKKSLRQTNPFDVLDDLIDIRLIDLDLLPGNR